MIIFLSLPGGSPGTTWPLQKKKKTFILVLVACEKATARKWKCKADLPTQDDWRKIRTEKHVTEQLRTKEEQTGQGLSH